MLKRTSRLKNRDGFCVALFALIYVGVLSLFSRLPRDEKAEEAYWSQAVSNLHMIAGASFIICGLTTFMQGYMFEIDPFKRALSWMVFYIDAASAITCFALEFKLLPVYFDAFGKIFCPAHFISWAATTPAMVYILSHIASISDRETYEAVAIDIVAVFCGLLSLCALPARLNTVAGVVGLYLFFVLMNKFMDMYRSGVDNVTAQRAGRASVVVRQAVNGIYFQVAFTIGLWSLFPVVWFLANMGLISGASQELAFTILNFFAKVLFANSTLLSNFAVLESEVAVDSIIEVEEVIEKETFLGSITKDLRNPLDGIIGLSDALVSADGLEPKQRRLITLIRNSGINLLALVSDILDILACRGGNLTMNFEEMDVQEAVKQVVATLTPLAGTEVSLRYSFQGFLPRIQADRKRVLQILNNLVGNSLKFTRKGHVTVSAQFFPDDDSVVLSVTDTGIGIPEDRMHKIFEEFEQVDGNIQREFGGTGLGLAIVKQLVDSHSGRITVTSRPNAGSTFTVLLPRAQDSKSAEMRRSKGRVIPPEAIIRHRSSQEYMRAPGGGVPDTAPAKSGESFYPSMISSPSPIDPLFDRDPSPAPGYSTDRRMRHREANGGEIMILSVDDDEVNQMVIEEILDTHSLRCHAAMNGDEALKFLRAQPHLPDLMLLDMMMPGMSEVEVAQHIRGTMNISTQDMPIIMISALSMEPIIRQARAAGVDDYILKPVSANVLMASIHRLLPSSRAALRTAQPDESDLESNLPEDDVSTTNAPGAGEGLEEDGQDTALPAALGQRKDIDSVSVTSSLRKRQLAGLHEPEDQMPSFAGHVPNVTAHPSGENDRFMRASHERERRFLQDLQSGAAPRIHTRASTDNHRRSQESQRMIGSAASNGSSLLANFAAQVAKDDAHSVDSLDASALFGGSSQTTTPATEPVAAILSDGSVSVDDLLTGRVDNLLQPATTRPKNRFAGAGEALVLAIDDDPFSQHVLDTIVDIVPTVRIMHAEKPTTALEHIRLSARLPDAVIIDNRMPEMTGLELVRVLRRSFPSAMLPIIMTTGDVRVSDDAYKAGCNRFVTKPYNMRHLTEDLLAVLEETGGLSPVLRDQKAKLENGKKNPSSQLSTDARGSYVALTANALQIRRGSSSSNMRNLATAGIEPGPPLMPSNIHDSSSNLSAADVKRLVQGTQGSFTSTVSSSFKSMSGPTTTASAGASIPSQPVLSIAGPSGRRSRDTRSTVSTAPSLPPAAQFLSSSSNMSSGTGSAASARAVLCVLQNEDYVEAVRAGARSVDTAAQVLPFNSCMAAMTRLFSSRLEPSLVIVDLEDETSARCELVQALKNRNGQEAMRVVAIGSDRQFEVAMELECDDYLIKPLQAKKLQGLVERLFSQC